MHISLIDLCCFLHYNIFVQIRQAFDFPLGYVIIVMKLRITVDFVVLQKEVIYDVYQVANIKDRRERQNIC